MARKSFLPSLVLCVALAMAAAAPAVGQQPAAREQVGKPVQAAQQLMKQKKFADALAKLREADGIKDKTAYEIYIVEETRAAAEIASASYAAALKSLDAVLASGMLPPPERLKRLHTQIQLAYQLKAYADVVDRANRYYRDGGVDNAPRLLMAQAYYLQNDFASAARTIRGMLQADNGAPPGEDILLTLASSEHQQKNEAGYRDALMRLATHYPKKQYWADLLSAVQRTPGFARRLTLDLDRLMVATGVMATADQYTAAAERALEAGFPGDAKTFLDKGYEAGVLGTGPQAERHKRLADMARRQSVEDAKMLPQLGKEADAAADGLAWEKLGQAYASYSQYDSAIAAFEKSLKKGALKHPEDATLHLGIAWLRAGQAARAKQVLIAISGTDGTADLARLWLIRGAGS